MDNYADVIIIGAGVSGLATAKVLTDIGVSVLVLDKGRHVGGRAATRRIGAGLIDHGTQFFTVESDTFREYVEQWIDDGLVFEWTQGFSQTSLHETATQELSYYAVRGGMNALAQHIAKPVKNILTGVQLITVTEDEEGWILQDSLGQIYSCKFLVMALPAPQALDLLDAGSTRLDDDDYDALAGITYSECVCGLFWVDGTLTLPELGAVHKQNANIIWIVDNRCKGLTSNETLITIQASAQYSRQIWNMPDDRVLSRLQTELSTYMDIGAIIKEAHLKRWRYARPLISYHEPYLYAKTELPLIFSGDGFGKGRIEGAYLSGLSAGRRVAHDFAKTTTS
jgi:renalase